MADNSKAQEALQDAEASAAPPPPYKERASIITETDDFQIIDEQDCYPENEKRPIEGSRTTSLREEKIPVDMPTRTPSMLKEKGPVYPPRRPGQKIAPKNDQQQPKLQFEDSNPLSYSSRPSKEAAFKDRLQEEAAELEDSTPLPSTEDGKAALEVHLVTEQETAPSMPQRPSASRFSEEFSQNEKSANMPPPMPTVPQQASELPLEYTFTWHRPILDFPCLHITPTPNIPIPSNSPSIPPTTSWKLIYTSKYQAALHRFGATQTKFPPEQGSDPQTTEYPFRQVASYKFPDFIIPGTNSGVKVLFEPHEEELARLGNLSNGWAEHEEKENKKSKKKDRKDRQSSSCGPPELQKFMQCTGWLSTKYTMEIPVLGHMQATFKTISRPRSQSAAMASGATNNYAPPPAPQTSYVDPTTPETSFHRVPSPYPTNNTTDANSNDNTRLITIGGLIDQARAKVVDESFTPYPQQHLIVEFDGREVATYQRSAPWGKTSGKLIINRPEVGQVYLTPEFVEGIIVATVAMAGMQERIGLANGLMEAVAAAGEGVRDGVLGSPGSSTGQGAGGSGGMVGRGREEWRRLVDEWKRRNHNGVTDWRAWNAYGNGDGQQQQERPIKGVYSSEHEGDVVGSEIFDDELRGVLTPEEREAARREQMMWDAERARTSSQVHSASPPHFTVSAPQTTTEWQQNTWSAEAQKWEEKPRIMYA
ncbi:hypothetical protein CERZMDRAFT_98835 [Cercospora zeae-maydis SCOH1-5]|uniref:Uncharacterized protein n=1 Tax=Cercospora zeae-maydis SCOH1-5 TaxID=717836 RepID=A0A6A6FCI7_9PEZI|nr:hypothetical protein CERZMDRAFT_98835 [Cercospora zeae-maydis SCOH1-5]